MSRPSHASWTIGVTFSPDISGDVSTWAMNPMVGAAWATVAGIVAMR
jgi:hypothetical protein